MLNLSDKELDRLSREAADLYEPDESSLSWSRLEQRLSEQMPERPPDSFRFGRISPYLWGPAVAIIAGISFYLVKNNFYSQHSTLTNHTVTGISPSGHSGNQGASDSSAAYKSNSKLNTGAVQGGSDASDSANANSKNTDQATLTLPPMPSEKSGKYIESTRGSEKEKVVSGSNVFDSEKSKNGLASGGFGKTTNGRHGNKSGDLLNESSLVASTALTANAALNGMNSGDRSRNQLSLPKVVSTGAGPVVVKGNDSLLNKFSLSSSRKPEKSLQINRSLNFGLIFGPDYTDAGGISNNQFGNNIGLTIGYYLTSKLSVNTGIIYTNKFYWSEGKGYNQPQYSQTGVSTYAASPPVELVNGSCNMWEIPLTLRYDFAQNRKSKFFANAGLSSYFMMKQSYIYFFHSNMRPLAWKTTDNEQQNYWFDVANISVGLETEIGKGFSFQVEPFMKLPLKNMGSENLKLNSYGVLLSFRYSPVLSRTKK